jgi:hypothetical protein
VRSGDDGDFSCESRVVCRTRRRVTFAATTDAHAADLMCERNLEESSAVGEKLEVTSRISVLCVSFFRGRNDDDDDVCQMT